MKKIILALAILTLPLLSFAKGVGYGNTKWDMNPTEVIAAQGNGAHLIPPEKYKERVGKVRIDNVSIGSGLYTVTFLFDSSDRLVQTNVSSNERKNEGIIVQQFGTLNQLLTQKYGKPEFSDSDNATWKLRDTTVELSKMVISGIMAQTVVRYIPNSRVANDTSNL
jgi:lipopolysaccharide export LptBFGC system permease protein LptF